MNKKIYFLLIFLFSLSSLVGYQEAPTDTYRAFYPNFYHNPLITKSMREKMTKHLLPRNHKISPIMDALFGGARVTKNEETLLAAGFEITHRQQSSHVILAKHAALPGYIFKIYLDSETKRKKGKPGWYWLTNRCIGVKKIKRLIQKKRLKYFVTPSKWLYPLPYFSKEDKQPVLLVVTDMQLASCGENIWAWKNLVTPEILDELYEILSHGYASNFLTGNIPYTKSGKFALIDTEHPKRTINLVKVKNYLSEEMQHYWDTLLPSH